MLVWEYQLANDIACHMRISILLCIYSLIPIWRKYGTKSTGSIVRIHITKWTFTVSLVWSRRRHSNFCTGFFIEHCFRNLFKFHTDIYMNLDVLYRVEGVGVPWCLLVEKTHYGVKLKLKFRCFRTFLPSHELQEEFKNFNKYSELFLTVDNLGSGRQLRWKIELLELVLHTTGRDPS